MQNNTELLKKKVSNIIAYLKYLHHKVENMIFLKISFNNDIKNNDTKSNKI